MFDRDPKQHLTQTTSWPASPGEQAVRTEPRAAETALADQELSWGWLPALSLLEACGLYLLSIADTYARAWNQWAEILFWATIFVLVLPIAIRLVSAHASRRERIGLVALLGLALYLVKVMHSPFAFTFSDELLHANTAIKIIQSHHLFPPNNILPVIAYYPGLETVTSALAELSGLSVFVSGLVVVGFARLILVVSLFLVFELISRSPRIAGVSTMLYMANPNFLFWSAQFSYESLALPIAAMMLFMVLRQENAKSRPEARALAVLSFIVMAAVIITHHLTSLLLIGLIFIISALYTFLQIFPINLFGMKSPNRKVSSHWLIALAGLALWLVWAIYEAPFVRIYLLQIFQPALQSAIQAILGQGTTRHLFQSTSGSVSPLWERIIGLSSAVLLLVGLVIGLNKIRKLPRIHPVALILTLAGIGYFGILMMRFLPAGWEIANRASEFLFVGLAFVLGYASLAIWENLRRGLFNKAFWTAAIAIIFMGGVITGWVPSLRIAKPYEVTVGHLTIVPQGISAAEWMNVMIGPNQKIAADEANSRPMLLYGGEDAFSGSYPNMKTILGEAALKPWEIDFLKNLQIRYILLDNRKISQNNMTGIYFDHTYGGALPSSQLYPANVMDKFNNIKGISRLFDSGNIAIYDIGAFINGTTVK